MNEKTAKTIGMIAIMILVFIAGFLIVTLPREEHNYEIHGADGKIYYTTRIYHGTNKIFFTDENGSRIELGGGYTVIQK
jgi:hypothetical protein